jgi:Arc/MetJ-type ribon-helix-helix transcriptional regulator
MAMSTERLEIRIPSATLQQLRQEARRRRVTTSDLAREAIRQLLEGQRREREEAAEALFRIGAPVSDWEEMKREIAAGYLKPALDG